MEANNKDGTENSANNNTKKEDEINLDEVIKKITEKNYKKYGTGNGALYSRMDRRDLVDTTLKRDDEILEIKKKMDELRYEVFILKHKLKRYEPEEYSPPDYTGYQVDWSSIRKVVFILKRNFMALTSSQLLKELLRIEPKYELLWNDPANSVSRILSRACKNKVVIRDDTPFMGAPLYKVPEDKLIKNY